MAEPGPSTATTAPGTGRRARLRPVWLTGIGALVLFGAIVVYLAPLKPSVLALQLAFTARSFGEVIHAWPPEHLERYRLHLVADGVLLLAYGAFGYLLATRTRVFAGLAPSLVALAKWSLPLAASCDALEDLLHAWLTAMPRFGVSGVYAVSATAALLKWLLLIGFGGLVALALARDEV